MIDLTGLSINHGEAIEISSYLLNKIYNYPKGIDSADTGKCEYCDSSNGLHKVNCINCGAPI